MATITTSDATNLFYKGDLPLSSRELAELQGISASYLAKVMPKLERAEIVKASEGVRGGYLLARDPKDLSVLQIVEAIDGEKPPFDCKEIRVLCPLFRPDPPAWATKGTCSIHAVLLRSEKARREELARDSLAGIAAAVVRKAPADFWDEVRDLIDDRVRVPARKPPRRRKGAGQVLSQ